MQRRDFAGAAQRDLALSQVADQRSDLRFDLRFEHSPMPTPPRFKPNSAWRHGFLLDPHGFPVAPACDPSMGLVLQDGATSTLAHEPVRDATGLPRAGVRGPRILAILGKARTRRWMTLV